MVKRSKANNKETCTKIIEYLGLVETPDDLQEVLANILLNSINYVVPEDIELHHKMLTFSHFLHNVQLHTIAAYCKVLDKESETSEESETIN